MFLLNIIFLLFNIAMKIAVVGIGVAGAYLMNRLSDDHDNQVVGFERMDKAELKETNDSRNNNIDIRLKGMVSYDKLKLIQDMIRGTKIEFGKMPKKENLESDFDIIIDSTGFHRNYLPKPKKEMWIPCVQYKVKYDSNDVPYNDFYLKAFPSMAGYFWYFPLGNGYAHIGAGDFERRQNNRFVDEFLNRHKCQIIKKVGRPVRISPPKHCEPFTDGRKVIGVGESIGTVYPLLGEGIIPSTWCAEMLVQNLYDMSAYRRAVLEKFRIYSLVFKFIKLKITGKFNMIK